MVTSGVGAGIGNALGGAAIAQHVGAAVANGIAAKARGGKFADGIKGYAKNMAINAAAAFAATKMIQGIGKLQEMLDAAAEEKFNTNGAEDQPTNIENPFSDYQAGYYKQVAALDTETDLFLDKQLRGDEARYYRCQAVDLCIENMLNGGAPSIIPREDYPTKKHRNQLVKYLKG